MASCITNKCYFCSIISVAFADRITSLWMSSITSRATWKRGCRITHLGAHPSPAKMAWQARAAPVEARSTIPLYRMPVSQHTCSLWRTHTNKGCRSSVPSTSSPSVPGQTNHSCLLSFIQSIISFISEWGLWPYQKWWRCGFFVFYF